MVAQVHAFPLHRHRGLVQRLAQKVSRAGTHGTRDAMIATLAIEWDRLEAYGVECDEIERCIHDLAQELWLAADRVSSPAVRV
ncbi:DUF6074 family protein [Bradyrhizobium sp. URHC0002]